MASLENEFLISKFNIIMFYNLKNFRICLETIIENSFLLLRTKNTFDNQILFSKKHLLVVFTYFFRTVLRNNYTNM